MCFLRHKLEAILKSTIPVKTLTSNSLQLGIQSCALFLQRQTDVEPTHYIIGSPLKAEPPPAKSLSTTL